MDRPGPFNDCQNDMQLRRPTSSSCLSRLARPICVQGSNIEAFAATSQSTVDFAQIGRRVSLYSPNAGKDFDIFMDLLLDSHVHVTAMY
ncbi:hypothetical protein BS50DRAFT_25031 [Corynespora cassiicola Philippines]|uniref:Uncharacterized protein n=1 Tax=Corynespora cassiicola Philippines TaxID=1448308 RepID=A0A2T2PAZ7_CORCC|nr:hypothetical protein BS50DRAFT_25031 [Corynespora cassiicola Philippines]